jgi:hypothetical protein
MTILSPDQLQGRTIVARRNYALKRGGSVDVLSLSTADGGREYVVAGPVSDADAPELELIMKDFTARQAKLAAATKPETQPKEAKK